jgi:aryl-alcohol dehydrogenase-like predicted oxidoreductase
MTDLKQIPGNATEIGTARYAQRLYGRAARGHFRRRAGLQWSSIGLGTYLGEPDQATDDAYRHAISRAMELGCNVIDSAINYRFQRSERSIGAALRELLQAGTIQRDELIVCTKGGYVPFDGGYPRDPRSYIRETYLRPGIARAEDFVNGHCITPAYLRHELDRSRQNLGLETIDLYYIHNPEQQLPVAGKPEFYRRLAAAFESLEQAVADGAIRAYGLATWTGFRQPPQAEDALSLIEVIGVAQQVAGQGHHFRAVQLPVNLAMTEALTRPTQIVNDQAVPFLDIAYRLGLTVVASASLVQGRLAHSLPVVIDRALPNLGSNAQRAVQFTRSLPGITTALVGMSQNEHVEDILSLVSVLPASEEQLYRLFQPG